MDLKWKIASGLASAAAGYVASKVVSASWRGITGRDAPIDDADDDFTVPEILAFAVTSAVVMAVAQVLATQATKKIYPRQIS